MSGGTNTVQQTLPSWLQPYLSAELSAASGMAGLPNPTSATSPSTAYPGGASGVIDTGDPRFGGGNSAANRILGSNGAGGAPAAAQTPAGGTLPSNPYAPGSPGLGGSGVPMAGSGSSDPSSFAQSLVAPLSPLQIQGIQSLASTANGVNPSLSAANANAWETSGALLNPSINPYLQNTFNLAANSVQNQLASEFAGAGSNVINSLPVQSDEMNNLATQLFGGAYQQGLTTMNQAEALSPSIQQGTYLPGQELYSTGGLQQQQQQQLINAPYNALSWYSGLLGLNGSSLGGSSQSNNPNAALQDAGMGIGALGTLASMFALAAA